jgi:chorismate--pyruvate lyase
LLDLPHNRYALVRQVALLCADTPWVFARTVIPRLTLRGAQRRLARLGARPLGALLFADPTLRRGCVELARLEWGQPLFREAAQFFGPPPRHLWARRSLFYTRENPLLVSEIFLPPLWPADGP